MTPSKYQRAVLQGTLGRQNIRCSWWPSIPIKGTASDVVGIFSATRLRNTVNERSMVTPEMKILNFESVCVRCDKTRHAQRDQPALDVDVVVLVVVVLCKVVVCSCGYKICNLGV